MLVRADCPVCGDALVDMSGGDGQYFHECQDCGEEWRIWRCRHCGAEFDEAPPRRDCPECGPNDSRIYK